MACKCKYNNVANDKEHFSQVTRRGVARYWVAGKLRLAKITRGKRKGSKYKKEKEKAVQYSHIRTRACIR